VATTVNKPDPTDCPLPTEPETGTPWCHAGAHWIDHSTVTELCPVALANRKAQRRQKQRRDIDERRRTEHQAFEIKAQKLAQDMLEDALIAQRAEQIVEAELARREADQENTSTT
jgi:hypothetical protein